MKTINPLRGLLALLALSAVSVAPTAAPQDLQRKYRQKLSKSFVRFGGWETDYDAARARAKKQDKVLFVYFSRSYSP